MPHGTTNADWPYFCCSENLILLLGFHKSRAAHGKVIIKLVHKHGYSSFVVYFHKLYTYFYFLSIDLWKKLAKIRKNNFSFNHAHSYFFDEIAEALIVLCFWYCIPLKEQVKGILLFPAFVNWKLLNNVDL